VDLTLAETQYDPGFVVPAHDHDLPFFCLNLRGTFTERFDRRSWVATPATIFYHPAGAEHAEEFGEVGGRLFLVQLGRDWLRRLDRFGVRPPDEQIKAFGGKLTRIALDVLREFRVGDTASDLAMDELTLSLLDRLMPLSRGGVRRHGSRPAWLGRVEELLHDQVANSANIASIATAVGVHPVYMARVFRRHHDCSPGEYLRRLRVERACALLADSSETLTAVAYAAGYADQSHFTRHFKRATGVTPGVYRRLVN
jgi:AraC family transcriptional regulator